MRLVQIPRSEYGDRMIDIFLSAGERGDARGESACTSRVAFPPVDVTVYLAAELSGEKKEGKRLC